MSNSSTITVEIPPKALQRLKVAEQRQRTETRKRGLRAEPVSVEGLLLLQTQAGKILCGCGCGEPLDFTSPWDEKNPPPSYPVIAHRLARGSRGEHTPRNLGIDRWACNKRDAGPDTSGAASVKRHTPDMQKKLLTPRDDRPSRNPNSWNKPASYVSKLSKEYRRKFVPARVKPVR